MAPILMALFAVIVGISAVLITKKPDSPVEVEAEKVIQDETGESVNLYNVIEGPKK